VPTLRSVRQHRVSEDQGAPGGLLVRDDIVDLILDEFVTVTSPFGSAYPTSLPPLTRRQKVRIRISHVKWKIHDRLFPECRSEW
jgi:hypothetical protein